MAKIKFPLPDDAVPTLELAQDDVKRLAAAEEAVVKRTVQQYHELLTLHHGVVDERQWKQIKQREDVRVYRERSTDAISRNKHNDDDNNDTFAAFVSILALGSMQGELDDIVYGSLSPSLQDMRLKTAYVEDGFLDWAFVASIIQPSATDPFRELSVKWTVTGAPSPLDLVIQGRYTLYIESIGFAHTPSGERIGYLLRHSVDLPAVHETLEKRYDSLTSAKLSTCYLFRQAAPDRVEVFMGGAIGAVDAGPASLADARASLIAKVSATVTVAVWKNFRHAEMKKLARIVQSSAVQRLRRATAVTTRPHSQSSSSSGSNSAAASVSCNSSSVSQSDQHASCAVCTKSVHGISSRLGFGSSSATSSRKHCRICAVRVCSRCRVVKTVFVSSTRLKDVVEESVTFCTLCLVRVKAVPAASFAVLDAQAAQGQFVDYSELL